MTPLAPPPPPAVADLGRLARTELSRGGRVGHVVLALVASLMTIVVVSLWLTEPALPLRTQIAFAALGGIGVAWVAFSLWVLRARRVMLAKHRQVAGRLAVLFSGVFAIGCGVLAAGKVTDAASPALAMGLVLLAIALVVWRRAETTHAKLVARRAALEQQLDRGPA
jgi:hypothetical protein